MQPPKDTRLKQEDYIQTAEAEAVHERADPGEITNE